MMESTSRPALNAKGKNDGVLVASNPKCRVERQVESACSGVRGGLVRYRD